MKQVPIDLTRFLEIGKAMRTNGPTSWSVRGGSARMALPGMSRQGKVRKAMTPAKLLPAVPSNNPLQRWQFGQEEKVHRCHDASLISPTIRTYRSHLQR